MEHRKCRKCQSSSAVWLCKNDSVYLCDSCSRDHSECNPGLKSITNSSQNLYVESFTDPKKATNGNFAPIVNTQLEKYKEICQSKSADMISQLRKLKEDLEACEIPPDIPQDYAQIFQVKMNLNLTDPLKTTYCSTRISIISVNFHNEKHEITEYKMQSELLLYSSIATVNRDLFLIGGMDVLGIPSDHFMKASLQTKSVVSVGALITPRIFSATIVKDLKIYIFGGITSNQSGTSSIELFDTQKNLFSSAGELSQPHKKTSACLFKDFIYIISSDSPIVEKFSVIKNTTETLRFQTNSLPFCMVFNFQNNLHLLTDCKVLTETSELFRIAPSMRWGQNGVIQWKQGVFYVNYLNNKLEKFNIFNNRLESISI